MREVHVIVPAGIDDLRRPTGGNVYDRHVCDGLGALGWCVHERPVPGPWPWPDATARRALAEALETVPDGEPALLDGLVVSAVPDIVAPHGSRLRLTVLLHMALGEMNPGARPQERALLQTATAVVTPSRWLREWLLANYGLSPARVRVAQPGVEAATPAPGTATADSLLCVGAAAPHKGYDVLMDAFAQLVDVPWTCRFAGPLDVAPEFADELRYRAGEYGISARLSFLGPLTRADLEAAYVGADALVVGSRNETYGMVVAEALAHNLPVISTEVGGVPEALGRASDGRRPGLLVPADDAPALAAAIREFLTRPRLRDDLRRAAADRARLLPGWAHTTGRVAQVLSAAASPATGV